MPAVDQTKVSLRIFGGTVDPEQITALLGANPDEPGNEITFESIGVTLPVAAFYRRVHFGDIAK